MLTFAINFVSGAIHKGCQHQGGGVEGAGGSGECQPNADSCGQGGGGLVK